MSKDKKNAALVSRVCGVLLLGIVCFFLGIGAAHYRVFPYNQIRDAVRIITSLAEHGAVVGEGRRFVAPSGATREFATIHDSDAVIGSGQYALLGWDSALGSYSVRLYDSAGEIVHTWPIDEMSFSDKPKHRQNAPHAMQVLSDGSVIIGFDWIGLVARVDACGKAIWVKEGFYHHAFAPAADGGIWTWYGASTAYGQLQHILKFDPETGEDMARIDFARDVVVRSQGSALQFSMTEDFPFALDDANPRDIFHPNDVEELLPELASAFPQFTAGDLMLSIRELDMVAVISQTGDLKWVQRGPWLKQHDPDFEPDGNIVVYNNSRFRPKSSILAIEPKTRIVTERHADLTAPFKSEFRGKHQRLPNGNRLITIPEQGQALELTADGTVAMEFNNIAVDAPGHNEDLANAKWLPDGFLMAFSVMSRSAGKGGFRQVSRAMVGDERLELPTSSV